MGGSSPTNFSRTWSTNKLRKPPLPPLENQVVLMKQGTKWVSDGIFYFEKCFVIYACLFRSLDVTAVTQYILKNSTVHSSLTYLKINRAILKSEDCCFKDRSALSVTS